MKGSRKECSCCGKETLRLVFDAVACFKCDSVEEWPNVKKRVG